MKIVHSCNRYYPYFGGLESHVQNISEKMVQLGHDVWVYTTDPTGKLPPSEILNGVKICRFKSFAPKDSYFFSTELYNSLRKTDCDIIHGHDLNGFPLLAGAMTKGRRKFIATLHVGAFSSNFRTLLRVPYDRFVMHALLARANRVICVSEYERKIYEKILRLPSSKFVVIPNGYDLDSNLVKYIPDESRTILSVGRLEKSKGFHYLIESFTIIGKNREFNDVKLNIVGKGPYESNLRKLISKLGLTEKVRIYQNVPRNKLLELYRQCTLFVLLSNYESAGLAVWDALAFQKPTITSTNAILGEYVQQGFSVGVKLPPNPEMLAVKIQNILREPSKYRPRKFKMLSWAQVAQKTISIYNEALIH